MNVCVGEVFQCFSETGQRWFSLCNVFFIHDIPLCAVMNMKRLFQLLKWDSQASVSTPKRRIIIGSTDYLR